MKHTETILIIDYGSQYTQLIARRIRENNVYCEIHPHTILTDAIKEINPSGIILSGGPMSVYDEGAPELNADIPELGVPVIGICYGLQLLALNSGGKVEQAKNREYGKAEFIVENQGNLLKGLPEKSVVWMSHGDLITGLPANFEVLGVSGNTPACAISDPVKNIYGLQFHPEVAHTEWGKQIISNFLFEICGCGANWNSENFIEQSANEIKSLVGDKKAICALSGGVDSSVAAILMHKAIGDKLICIHVDSGLMRLDESRDIVKMFRDNYDLHLIHVDASELFLGRLAGVDDPEKKRKIIGNTFIEVFEKEAKKFSDADFLVQGTLYPDVIESVPVKGASVTIKSHHNVGGLPEKMNLKLIEPFRELFKDEVRKIGYDLGLPADFIKRHPFPGPGLAVRIPGRLEPGMLDILRQADDIYISALHEFNIYDEIWQAFAVLLPVRSVGVMGDARTYENVVALRAVVSTDGMTADWYKFDHDFLHYVSNKIIQEVRGVNRVVYDISSKPPSTIEWE